MICSVKEIAKRRAYTEREKEKERLAGGTKYCVYYFPLLASLLLIQWAWTRLVAVGSPYEPSCLLRPVSEFSRTHPLYRFISPTPFGLAKAWTGAHHALLEGERERESL